MVRPSSHLYFPREPRVCDSFWDWICDIEARKLVLIYKKYPESLKFIQTYHFVKQTNSKSESVRRERALKLFRRPEIYYSCTKYLVVL